MDTAKCRPFNLDYIQCIFQQLAEEIPFIIESEEEVVDSKLTIYIHNLAIMLRCNAFE